jgi:hypothetical protein
LAAVQDFDLLLLGKKLNIAVLKIFKSDIDNINKQIPSSLLSDQFFNET